MENVILIIHLILAVGLVGVVLLQRSEGGGLGMGGGGGGGGGLMTGRQAATALAKVTWVLAIGFLATSTVLTIMAARDSAGQSVVDQIGGSISEQAPASATPKQIPQNKVPSAKSLLPPAPASDSSSQAPATPAPAAPAPDTSSQTSAPATGGTAPAAPATPAPAEPSGGN